MQRAGECCKDSNQSLIFLDSSLTFSSQTLCSLRGPPAFTLLIPDLGIKWIQNAINLNLLETWLRTTVIGLQIQTLQLQYGLLQRWPTNSLNISSCSRLHTSTLEMQAISRALSRLPVDFPAPLVVMGFFGLEKSQAPHPTCPTWNNRILKDAVARKSSGWHFCSQTNMLQHVTTIGTRSHFSVAGIFFTPQEPPLKGTPFRCFPAWSPGFGWTCKWLEKSLRSIIGSSNFQRVP